MKKVLSYLLVFVLGFTLAVVPDLASIFQEKLERPYQVEACKGIAPAKCEFDYNGWNTKFGYDHPKVQNMGYYFQLGEGPLYWVLTGRCSLKPFNNPSAAGKLSGKITNRDYFYSRCSHFMNDLSDIIFQEGEK